MLQRVSLAYAEQNGLLINTFLLEKLRVPADVVDGPEAEGIAFGVKNQECTRYTRLPLTDRLLIGY